MDVTVPMDCLNASDLDNMILKMREEGLSDCSINSYTRTLKVFFSWCNEEGHSNLNIKLCKAAETVKEVYTDDELLALLKKPEANCNFCEYRNWVIINFLLNSGCRAATVRNILNQDVDLARKQIVLRHTKNGKVQVIPLCSSMVAILRDYMVVRGGGGNDYLFCNEFGDLLTENALRLAIVRYNTARGVQRTSISPIEGDDTDLVQFGQGAYRNHLIEEVQYCVCCDAYNLKKLHAIHILPDAWSDDPASREAIGNGLLMCYEHAQEYLHKRFYFDRNGRIVNVSSSLVHKHMRLSQKLLTGERKSYLAAYASKLTD